MQKKIGTLTRIPIKEAWAHEAYSFTTWMQANIGVLGEAIGLDLDSAEKEQAAGVFSVDIVAVTSDGRTVVIENQFGKSNHDHLGKVITYLTSFDANCAVWVVEEARPEHINAITWLNEQTAVDFYLVKVEAVWIDDSPPAALFTSIVGPSEEGKIIGAEKKELQERHKLRRSFWEMLLGRAKRSTSLHAKVSPSHYSWLGAGAGISGLSFNYSVTRNGTKSELYIDRGNADLNERIFDHFFERKAEIEQIAGQQISWQRLEGRKACRIAILHEGGGYMSPRDEWPSLIDQVVASMVKLEKALTPHIDSAPTK